MRPMGDVFLQDFPCGRHVDPCRIEAKESCPLPEGRLETELVDGLGELFEAVHRDKVEMKVGPLQPEPIEIDNRNTGVHTELKLRSTALPSHLVSRALRVLDRGLDGKLEALPGLEGRVELTIEDDGGVGLNLPTRKVKNK